MTPRRFGRLHFTTRGPVLAGHLRSALRAVEQQAAPHAPTRPRWAHPRGTGNPARAPGSNRSSPAAAAPGELPGTDNGPIWARTLPETDAASEAQAPATSSRLTPAEAAQSHPLPQASETRCWCSRSLRLAARGEDRDRRSEKHPHHPVAPLEPRAAHTGRYGAKAKERLTARLSHGEWTDKRCPGSLRVALVMPNHRCRSARTDRATSPDPPAWPPRTPSGPDGSTPRTQQHSCRI